MLTQGGLGGVFAYASYTASTIAFVEGGASPDYITDSANGFLTAGFIARMSITISDTVSNNKTVTIDTVTASRITLIATDDLVDEEEGSATLATATYGTQLLGFENQTINTGIKESIKTTYEDYPYETFITTIKNGGATLSRFWITTDPESWEGRSLNLRLFKRFSATPSATDPAVYYSGTGKITASNFSAPLGEAVKDSISVAFSGTILRTVKTDAW